MRKTGSGLEVAERIRRLPDLVSSEFNLKISKRKSHSK